MKTITKRFFSQIILLTVFMWIIPYYNHAIGSPICSTDDKPENAVVTVLMNTYTYPTAISANGNYVVGSPFGGITGYFWSAGTGVIQFPGEVYGVSDNGIASGTWSNPTVQYNGNNVYTAGTWDHTTSQWTFLGMNPAVPSLFSTDYNVGYDITSDGSTIVGMQWYQNYSVSAFKWTQSGYSMIGTGVGQGSRPNGISANGIVTFGWAEVGGVSRTPVIWYNNQVIYINQAEFGEAFGASTNGNFVTGNVGSSGFLWSPQGTVLFTNTINTGPISPTTVSNDGTVFGYTYTAPTARRAFVRDSLGNMTTFNDYAAARGLADAQLWTFYSINDVSADGNKMIGAGKNPAGLNVTFLIEFIPDIPVLTITPTSIPFGEVSVGTQSLPQQLFMTNTGTGTLTVNSLTITGGNANQFLKTDNNTYPIVLGPGDSAQVAVTFAPTSQGYKSANIEITASTGTPQVPLSGTGGAGVGLEENTQDAFKMFPIPASDWLNFSYRPGIAQITIYDQTGRLVYRVDGKLQSELTVDIRRLTPGHYYITCNGTDKSIHQAELIVQRNN